MLGVGMLTLPVTAASDKRVVIDRVFVDNESASVSVSGHIENYVKVFISQGITVFVTDENDGSIRHLAEAEPDEDGAFSYTYKHNLKNAVDTCRITVRFLDSPNTAEAVYSVSGGSVYDIFADTIVFKKGSMTYFADGVKCETQKPVYEENGIVYIPCVEEIKTLGYKGENGYVKLSDISEMKSDGEFFATGDFDLKIAKAASDYFGIYVSNGGSDENTGEADSPVKTIERALSLYSLSNGSPTVYLGDGEYTLEKALSLNEAYSGLSIKAYAGAKPVLKRGVKIPSESFKPLEESDRDLFPEEAADKILYADFSEFYSELSPYEYGVFSKDGRAINSRYPNENEFAELSAVNPDAVTSADESVYIEKEKADLWGDLWESGEPDGIITFYRACRYVTNTKRILSVSKSDSSMKIKGTNGAYSPISTSTMKTNSYFAENISKELDREGEYYINSDKTKIFFYPDSDFEGLEAVNDKNPIVSIENAKNITFDGISFKNSGGDAVKITNCDGVKIQNGEISHIRGNGINAEKAVNTSFNALKIQNVGLCGITLNYFTQTGYIKSLRSENNIISDCEIAFYGEIELMRPGVYMGGCGNKIESSIIHDGKQSAINMQGAENKIIGNEVYNACLMARDCGVIYLAGFNSAGNTVSKNIIRDTPGTAWNDNWVYGIYLDNASSGITVSDNYIYSVPHGFYGNGGTSNSLIDNIFADVHSVSFINTSYHYYYEAQNTSDIATFHHNVLENGVYYTQAKNVVENYDEVWREKYPFIYDYYEELSENKQKTDENGELIKDKNGNHICENQTVGMPKNIVATGNIIAGRKGSENTPTFSFTKISDSSNVIENNSVLTYSEFLDDSIKLSEVKTDGKEGVRIISLLDEPIDFNVIFAEKDSTGLLKDIEIYSEKDFSPIEGKCYYYTPADSENSLEVFLWDGLKPLLQKTKLK